MREVCQGVGAQVEAVVEAEALEGVGGKFIYIH